MGPVGDFLDKSFFLGGQLFYTFFLSAFDKSFGGFLVG